MVECFSKINRIVPILKPKLAVSDFLHQLLPLFGSNSRLDIGRIEVKYTVKFIPVPLAYDVIALRYVIYDGFYIAVIIGVHLLDSQVLAVTQHLIAQS